MIKTWKTIRVFISSTFRDMQAERDYLVRFVFPRLREQLIAYQVHLVDVDLRWGVTTDQDAFDLCMDEISRCRPRFICLLGGRYGWVPPPKSIPAGWLQERFNQVNQEGQISSAQQEVLLKLYSYDSEGKIYRLIDKPHREVEINEWNALGEKVVEILHQAGYPDLSSITAAEIDFGALSHPEEPAFRYFYFRQPEATASIPEPEGRNYREPKGSFKQFALEALKQKIRNTVSKVQLVPGQLSDTPLPIFDYPCQWDSASRGIVGLEQFGERVYQDLLESVRAELGVQQPGVLDEFSAQNASIDAYVQTLTERYTLGSRQPILEILQSHAGSHDDKPYLCLVGEPGSGKSALLAEFYRLALVEESSSKSSPPPLLIAHFIGIASSDVRRLLRRLCHEITHQTNIEIEIPEDYDKLIALFPALLEQAAGKRRIVLVLDAINQLDPSYGAFTMTWLPDHLPDGVRVVLSCLPCPALQVLRERREPPVEVNLPALQEADKESITAGFLGRYRKQLDDVQLSLLHQKEGASTPLYLLSALEELRTFGIYDQVTEQIREMPADIPGLFDWILARLEADPLFASRDGKFVGRELVQGYLSMLAAARPGTGLSSQELAEIIAPGDASGNVAALERLLRPYLMNRGELLDFAHDQFRLAVSHRYLSREENRVGVHARLVGFFLSRGVDNPRTLSELVYQLVQAGQDTQFIQLMDGEFPDIKLARLSSVAEVAHDYLLAIDACERQSDFYHAARFGYRRSLFAAEAELITQPKVARVIGKISAGLGNLDEFRRAEAIAREFLEDPTELVCALSGLAAGMADSPEGERLLGAVFPILKHLPCGEDREKPLIETLAALLGRDHPDQEQMQWIFEQALLEKGTRQEAIILMAVFLWKQGDHSADRMLADEMPAWVEFPPGLQEKTHSAALVVWESYGSIQAAAEFLGDLARLEEPEMVFQSLLKATFSHAVDWAKSFTDWADINWEKRAFGLAALKIAWGEGDRSTLEILKRNIGIQNKLGGLLRKSLIAPLLPTGFMLEFLEADELKLTSKISYTTVGQEIPQDECTAIGIAQARTLPSSPLTQEAYSRMAFIAARVSDIAVDQADVNYDQIISYVKRRKSRFVREKLLFAMVETALLSRSYRSAQQALIAWQQTSFDRLLKKNRVGSMDRIKGMITLIYLAFAGGTIWWVITGAGSNSNTSPFFLNVWNRLLGALGIWVFLTGIFFISGLLPIDSWMRIYSERKWRNAKGDPWRYASTLSRQIDYFLKKPESFLGKLGRGVTLPFHKALLGAQLERLDGTQIPDGKLATLMDWCIPRKAHTLASSVGVAAFRTGDEATARSAVNFLHGVDTIIEIGSSLPDLLGRLAGASFNLYGWVDSTINPGKEDRLDAFRQTLKYTILYACGEGARGKAAFQGLRYLMKQAPKIYLTGLWEIIHESEKHSSLSKKVIRNTQAVFGLPGLGKILYRKYGSGLAFLIGFIGSMAMIMLYILGPFLVAGITWGIWIGAAAFGLWIGILIGLTKLGGVLEMTLRHKSLKLVQPE